MPTSPCLRHLPLSCVLLVSLSACPEGGAEADAQTGTGDGDGDGDEDQPCATPGSPLLDGVKTVSLPGPTNTPSFTCSTGWATDVPVRDASWTIQLGEGLVDAWSAIIDIAAHPDGGVVVVSTELFARYDADGEELWSSTTGAPVEGTAVLTVEEAGTIVLATYNWNAETQTLRRYDADGGTIGAVDVTWLGMFPNVWALDTYGPNLVIGAVDQDAEGNWEQVLLHLDPSDAQLLRKSTSMSNGNLLAVSPDGSVAFGLGPAFLLAIDDGAVIGTLQPSAGFAQRFDGIGDGFVMVGRSSGDLSLGRYSSAGVERWLQTYDRAGANEQGRDVAASGDVVVAVGSTTMLVIDQDTWLGTQPLVVAANLDGEARWIDRIDAHGDASAVAIGSAGEIYVAGMAETSDSSTQGSIRQLRWLRRYEP